MVPQSRVDFESVIDISKNPNPVSHIAFSIKFDITASQ